jgi:hypothetical protein
MFLKNVNSKGNVYIYLCAYNHEDQDKKILFSFGRVDKALRSMYEWKDDFCEFPSDLSKIGCTRNDLIDWIRKLESRITRTGKRFKSVI